MQYIKQNGCYFVTIIIIYNTVYKQLFNVLLYLSCICEFPIIRIESGMFLFSIKCSILTYPDCIIIILTYIVLYIQKYTNSGAISQFEYNIAN